MARGIEVTLDRDIEDKGIRPCGIEVTPKDHVVIEASVKEQYSPFCAAGAGVTVWFGFTRRIRFFNGTNRRGIVYWGS